MAKFIQFVHSWLEFENGYKLFFEPSGVAPFSVKAHVWFDGVRQPMDLFVPDSANGYLTADGFAKLAYKVSKAVAPEIEEDSDVYPHL